MHRKNRKKNEFIELRSTCARSFSLQGYKLIELTAGPRSESIPMIELVVTLWNSHTNKNGYFTIGGSSVATAEINVPNDFIRFRQCFNNGTIAFVTNFMLNDNSNLQAIGLLYSRGNSLPSIALTKKKNYMLLDDTIIQILKEHLVDLVVYGKKIDQNRCNIYEEIYPGFLNRKYTLREFDTKEGDDYSLNRCALEGLGFLPEKFKLGKPTPEAETGPHYILEDHILNVVPPVNTHHKYPLDYDVDYTYEPQCSSSIERTEYFRTHQQSIMESIKKENTTAFEDVCTPNLLNPEGANIVQEIDNTNNRNRHIGANVDYSEELEWETEKYFK